MCSMTQTLDTPLTTNEWKEYVEFNSSSSRYTEYLTATAEIVQRLEAMVNRKMSGEKILQEIKDFCRDRKDFLEYAYAHTPE